MGGGTQSDDDELITAINVTPLVDVVLVLLIILMVTASYIVSRSIPMELPRASEADPTAIPRSLNVSLDQAGVLYLDAERITEEELVRRVGRYREEVPDTDERAVIAADGRATHAQVVHLIDLLRRNGITRFAINVRPEDLAG